MLIQAFRRLMLRLKGVRVPRKVKLGRNLRMSGCVSIGSSTTIEDNVILTGSIKIGQRCRIGRGVEIFGNIEIGDQSVIGSFSILSTGPKGHLQIGKDSYINSFSVLGASSGLKIGNHCIFAPFVHITDATHGIDDISIKTKDAEIKSSPVDIGDNVWLGTGVTVLMGSSIGKDSVVGAHSLVRNALPAQSVSFGTPASVHRFRWHPERRTFEKH